MSVVTLTKTTAKKPMHVLNLKQEIVTVTPTLATAWFDKNKINRKLKRGVVDAYARDMIAGNWPLTGDAIRFDVNGDLLDGQHRLKACIQADCSFRTVVFYGVDPDARDFIDIGKSRNIRDIMAMHGMLNITAASAAAGIIFALKNNDGRLGKSVKSSPAELISLLDAHPMLQRSCNLTDGTKGIVRSALTALHYVTAELIGPRSRADAFVDVFKTGIPDYPGCPAQKFRERMLKIGMSKERTERINHWLGLVHAWNAFSKKEAIDIARIPKDAKIRGLKLELL